MVFQQARDNQPVPLQVIFYWDYDGEFGGERTKNPRRGWGYRDYEGTKRILDVLDEYGIKAVFAIVGCAATPGPLPYHAPALIREIHERGHEVAAHAWQHEWLPSLKYHQLCQILRWSKEALEDACGDEVISFVPPWNVPHRFLRKFSLGIGELRHSFPSPTDIPSLFEALAETGFQTCRALYEPFPWTVERMLFDHYRIYTPRNPEWVGNVLLIPVTTPGGFASDSTSVLDGQSGNGICSFWSHPQEFLHRDGRGCEENFRVLAERVKGMEQAGQLQICTAKGLIARV